MAESHYLVLNMFVYVPMWRYPAEEIHNIYRTIKSSSISIFLEAGQLTEGYVMHFRDLNDYIELYQQKSSPSLGFLGILTWLRESDSSDFTSLETSKFKNPPFQHILMCTWVFPGGWTYHIIWIAEIRQKNFFPMFVQDSWNLSCRCLLNVLCANPMIVLFLPFWFPSPHVKTHSAKHY